MGAEKKVYIGMHFGIVGQKSVVSEEIAAAQSRIGSPAGCPHNPEVIFRKIPGRTGQLLRLAEAFNTRHTVVNGVLQPEKVEQPAMLSVGFQGKGIFCKEAV